MRKTWIRASGFFGIITPLIAFACIIAATALASSFSWTDNALSDLGVMPEPTATLFNTSLIISGILTILFATGLYLSFEKSALGRFGAMIFSLCAVALTSIGVFTENMRPMHVYASVAFFALFPVSMFVFATSFFLLAKPKKTVFTLAVALFAVLVWVLEFAIRYVPGVAIPETLSALAASLWAVVLGFKMVSNGSRSGK